MDVFKKCENVLLIFVVSFLFFLEIFFRSIGIPIIGGDAVFFYPIAENFAQQNGLFHPVMSPITSRGGALTWHGWLHPYVLGFLGRLFPDPFIGITISETLIVGIGCIGFTTTFCSAYREVSVYVKGAVVMSVVAVAFGYLGRPESLAFVLLVAGIASIHYLEEGAVRFGLVVVLWGGIGATQPTVALLIGPVLLGYMIISETNVHSALNKWLVVGAASVAATFLLTAVLYPYSVAEWINGLWQHSQKIASRGDTGRKLYYYFLQPSRFMQGGWYILAAACGTLLLWQSNETRNWGLVGVALIGAGLAWYTSIRVPPTRYNLFALLPVFTIIVQESLTKLEGVRLISATKILVILLGLSSVLITGRRSKVFIQSTHGPSRQEVAIKLDKIKENKICIDKGLLFSTYNPRRWDDFCLMDSKLPNGKERYAVVRQAGLGRLNPPKVKNYTILFDNFRNSGIYFGPLKIANTDDSYRFAIYKKIN